MRITVVKFGGPTLATHALRQIAVRRVQEVYAEGFQPVIVVSALGRRGDPYATDTLINLAPCNGARLSPRDLALLASCGEIIAAVVMTGLLREAGLNATALTGGQAGILTTDGFTGAHIASISPAPLLEILQAGKIPVVAGFQGSNADGEVCVLERGGSDISCAAIGCALQAESAHIFKEVPGIHTADPAIVPEARLFRKLSYRNALPMALHGTKAVHPGAVMWAMRGCLPIYVDCIHDPSRSTLITDDQDRLDGWRFAIAAMPAGAEDLMAVSLVNISDGEESRLGDAVKETLRDADIPALDVVASSVAVTAIVNRGHANKAQVVLHDRFLIHETKQEQPCQRHRISADQI